MSTLDELEDERHQSRQPPLCLRCSDRPAIAEQNWAFCATCGVYPNLGPALAQVGNRKEPR